MSLNNNPLFGLLGIESCIEHITRLRGYRGFPLTQFCSPPSYNITMIAASPSSLGDDNASRNLGWNQTAKDCRCFSYIRLQRKIQGMTPPSTPPTRLIIYSGSKSKPPPLSPLFRTVWRSWCQSIDGIPHP